MDTPDPRITAHAYPTRNGASRVDVRDAHGDLVEAFDDHGRTVYSRRERIGQR